MITHDGAWNLWLLNFFYRFGNKLGTVGSFGSQRLQWSSWAPLHPQMNHLLLGFGPVSVGQERYWNMKKLMNKWQFLDVELLLWKNFLLRVRIWNGAWFLHLYPLVSPRFSMAAQVFQFPAAGDNESSAAIAARDPKIILCNQSVDVRPKKTWCFIWYTCVNIQFLAPSIFIS